MTELPPPVYSVDPEPQPSEPLPSAVDLIVRLVGEEDYEEDFGVVVGMVMAVGGGAGLGEIRRLVCEVEGLVGRRGEPLDGFRYLIVKEATRVPISPTQEKTLTLSTYLSRLGPQHKKASAPTIYISLPEQSSSPPLNARAFAEAMNHVSTSVGMASNSFLMSVGVGSGGVGRIVREPNPKLCDGPREIPWAVRLATMFVAGMGFEIFAYVCCLVAAVQGSIWCIEPIIFVPPAVFGLFRLFRSRKILHLLRNGVDIIPRVRESKSGFLIGNTVIEASGSITSNVGYPSGQWETSHTPFRETMTVTTLEIPEKIDPKTGKPVEFLFAPTRFMGSVVLFDPERPRTYLHVHEIPFGLRPDPTDGGKWHVPKQKRFLVGLLVVVAFVNCLLFFVGVLGLVGIAARPGNYIFVKRGLPNCRTNMGRTTK
ncbi:hypothetical protein HDU67_007256 [Dinochytrium kinnereticum]|nr:hypothetical protein HDU67_007256 [Dinochytrium kinnereticum]